MFKLCVVGCGGIANIAHFPAIAKYKAQHPDVALVACMDTDLARADAAKEKWNIPHAYTDIDTMLKAEHPDAVLCLVPEFIVSSIACDILRKGYAVLLEKPPGKTLEEVRAIVETSDTAGVPHMVAFNRRFSPHLLALKEKLVGQDIVSIDYTMERINRTENHFETTVIHAVDAVLFLAGCKAKQVEIRYQEMPHLGEKVANFYLYFTFARSVHSNAPNNTFTATVRIYPNTGNVLEHATVYTADAVWETLLPQQGSETELGHIKQYADKALQLEVAGADLTTPDHPTSNGFYGELAYFIDCMQSGTRPIHTAETAYQPVIVCDLMKNRVRKYLFE